MRKEERFIISEMPAKKKPPVDEDPLDREIDFSNARPNPYFLWYHRSRNLRVLAPDLLDAFPDSESVNEALRELVRTKTTAPTKTRKKAHS